NFSNHREDFSSICNPGSIDISFHDASENHSCPLLATAEVYFDQINSSTFLWFYQLLKVSQYAFYTVTHVSYNDFYDIEPVIVKTRMDDILFNKFINDDISYDDVINSKRSPTFEKIKKDSSQKLRDTPELYLQPTFFKSFGHAYDYMNKNQFAILIA
ncbi:8227_t:CDS:2, partial [Gigaspora rosea]